MQGDKWGETNEEAGAAAISVISMQGDKWRRETRSGSDFGNQQPNLWEVRTPIASSYLGNKKYSGDGQDIWARHAWSIGKWSGHCLFKIWPMSFQCSIDVRSTTLPSCKGEFVDDIRWREIRWAQYENCYVPKIPCLAWAWWTINLTCSRLSTLRGSTRPNNPNASLKDSWSHESRGLPSRLYSIRGTKVWGSKRTCRIGSWGLDLRMCQTKQWIAQTKQRNKASATTSRFSHAWLAQNMSTQRCVRCVQKRKVYPHKLIHRWAGGVGPSVWIVVKTGGSQSGSSGSGLFCNTRKGRREKYL